MNFKQFDREFEMLLWLFVIALLAYLFVGCCSTPQTIINKRVDTLYVPILGTLDTVLITRTDSVWAGESVRYIVKVDTLIKRVYINRKADTVTVYHAYPDTVQVFNKTGDSFKDNLYDYAAGFVIAVIFLGLVIVLSKRLI